MLLVDRILEVNEDHTKCRGLKNVTMNEAFFQGHYPGKPIMPGVLILESMAQVGAVIMMLDMKTKGADVVPLIGAIDNVKFKRVVVPGDQLIVDAEIMWMRGSVGKLHAVGSVDGEMAATMEMTFKLRPRDR